MASGIASPWGDTPLMVTGINNPMEINGRHLTGQLSLTSTPVFFENGTMVSPLTIANKNYYTAFGKHVKKTFVKKSKVNFIVADIKYLKSI